MAIKIPRVQTTDRLINQLQQNICGVIEPLFNGLNGGFMTGLTGCATVPTGFITWQRAIVGGPVTLLFPSLSGTSNATTAYLTGLPSALWPVSTQYLIGRTIDNGADAAPALITIDPQGVIQLFASISSDVFTASGAKGISALCATYITAI